MKIASFSRELVLVLVTRNRAVDLHTEKAYTDCFQVNTSADGGGIHGIGTQSLWSLAPFKNGSK